MDRNKVIKIVCILLPALIVCVQYTSGVNNTTLYLSCICCFFMAVYEPLYGISNSVLFSVTSAANEHSEYITIALALGVFINCFLHGGFHKINLNKVWLPLLLIFCTVFTYLFESRPQTAVYMLLFVELLMSILLINREITPERRVDSLNMLSFAYITSAILYSIFSILTMSSTTARLRAYNEGTVRGLANILGLAIIFCLFNLSVKDKKKLPYLCGAVFCSVILLMTGSRGVMYSIIIIAILFALKERLLKPKYILVISLFLFVASIFVYNYMPTNLNLSRIFESDDGSRIHIWKQLLGTNGFKQWVVGAGLNNSHSTFGWYSHSVYIDTLVSLGVVPFVGLIVYVVFSMISSFKNFRDMSGFLLLAAVLFFLTHGSIFSFTFWILLIISNYLPENDTISGLEKDAERR